MKEFKGVQGIIERREGSSDSPIHPTLWTHVSRDLEQSDLCTYVAPPYTILLISNNSKSESEP